MANSRYLKVNVDYQEMNDIFERMTISEQIRQLARGRAAKIGHNELARQSGINAGLLSRFLRGTSGLSLASLDRLAHVLGARITTAPTRKSR